MNENCSNCKFYRALPEATCRAHPPQVFPIPTPQGLTILGQFPPTRPEGWCGEYKLHPDQAVTL